MSHGAADHRARFTLAPMQATSPEAGGPAFGVAAPIERVAARARGLARRARRYRGLRLALTEDLAIFWAPQPAPLPWFDAVAFYIGAPHRRIFAPFGWRLSTPDILLDPLLEALMRERGASPPLVIAPPDHGGADAAESAALRLIALSESALLEDVDFSALERQCAGRARGARRA